MGVHCSPWIVFICPEQLSSTYLPTYLPVQTADPAHTSHPSKDRIVWATLPRLLYGRGRAKRDGILGGTTPTRTPNPD